MGLAQLHHLPMLEAEEELLWGKEEITLFLGKSVSSEGPLQAPNRCHARPLHRTPSLDGRVCPCGCSGAMRPSKLQEEGIFVKGARVLGSCSQCARYAHIHPRIQLALLGAPRWYWQRIEGSRLNLAMAGNSFSILHVLLEIGTLIEAMDENEGRDGFSMARLIACCAMEADIPPPKGFDQILRSVLSAEQASLDIWDVAVVVSEIEPALSHAEAVWHASRIMLHQVGSFWATISSLIALPVAEKVLAEFIIREAKSQPTLPLVDGGSPSSIHTAIVSEPQQAEADHEPTPTQFWGDDSTMRNTDEDPSQISPDASAPTAASSGLVGLYASTLEQEICEILQGHQPEVSPTLTFVPASEVVPAFADPYL